MTDLPTHTCSLLPFRCIRTHVQMQVHKRQLGNDTLEDAFVGWLDPNELQYFLGILNGETFEFRESRRLSGGEVFSSV